MVKIIKSRLSRRKSILILFGVFVALGLLLVVLEKNQVTNLYTKGSPQNTEDVQTTSTEPSAQENFTSGDNREAGNSLREDEGVASVTDTSGAIDSSTDRSQSITSSTGEITVFTPSQGSIVESQIRITGETTLQSVSYRLVDSISGVLTRGEFTVVNGQFSGVLRIDTGASEGRLDIFGQQADGNEFSNITIPLKFRQ